MFKLLFLALTLIGLNESFAQQKSGYIKYSIDVIVLDTTPENLNVGRLLRDSKIELFVTENNYRVESYTGPFGSSSMICDYSKGQILTLSTNTMGKYARITTIKDALKKPEKIVTNTVVNRDRQRKILGFNCYYVELTENGSTGKFWCTDEIDFRLQGQSFMSESLPGYPLSIQKEDSGFQFTYTASNFIDRIDNPEITFSLEIPEGYTMIPNN
jgi:hypothetical protein